MSPDVHTLTGAYALDALDEPERLAFESHLAECPDCALEVRELRETAVRLALAEAEPPPAQLWHRVSARIATTRQEPPSRASVEPASKTRPVRVWVMRTAVTVAAAAAMVFGVLTVRTAAELSTTRAQLADLQAQYWTVTRLAAAPDTRSVTGDGAAGGSGLVLLSASLNEAVLVTSDLPAPPAGHTYQAWLIGAAGPRSVGVLSSSGQPLVFDQLAGARQVGVTVEPAGGSPAPTTTPVMLMSLPS